MNPGSPPPAPTRAPASSGVQTMPSLSRGGRRLSPAVWALPLAAVAGFAAWLALHCATAGTAVARADEPEKSTRVPWKGSRVVGSPDPPPPFKVVRAFPNLKFEHPLLLAR